MPARGRPIRYTCDDQRDVRTSSACNRSCNTSRPAPIGEPRDANRMESCLGKERPEQIGKADDLGGAGTTQEDQRLRQHDASEQERTHVGCSSCDEAVRLLLGRVDDWRRWRRPRRDRRDRREWRGHEPNDEAVGQVPGGRRRRPTRVGQLPPKGGRLTQQRSESILSA